jgi:hypothetical protein
MKSLTNCENPSSNIQEAAHTALKMVLEAAYGPENRSESRLCHVLENLRGFFMHPTRG